MVWQVPTTSPRVARVEEAFEARNPKGEAVIAEIDGAVDIEWEGEAAHAEDQPHRSEAARGGDSQPAMIRWCWMATVCRRILSIARQGGRRAAIDDVLAGMDGEVFVEAMDDGHVMATSAVKIRKSGKRRFRPMPACVSTSDAQVKAGDQLTEGAKNPKEILRIQGREAASSTCWTKCRRSIAARVCRSTTSTSK